MNDQVEDELAEIRANYEQNKRQVIKMLLDQILIVNTDVAKVVQQRFECGQVPHPVVLGK